MTLTLVGWILIISSLAVSALLVSPARSATPDLLSRLRSSGRGLGQDLRSYRGTLALAATAFLLVAGIGAAASYVGGPSGAAGSGYAISAPQPASGPDGEMLASLNEYARSIDTKEPAPKDAPEKLLPDVNTMIERLAARLQTTPKDLAGWRMLGWSYFNMERYEDAAVAYTKALELDPSSSELKQAYEDAKAKASGSKSSETSPLQTGAVGGVNHGSSPTETAKSETAKSEAAAPPEANAAIRAMVDGLAARLETSPRDADGWARLMRSRVVLGEKEVAATAYRKALEVFKDDSEASARITAAATELGLKTE